MVPSRPEGSSRAAGHATVAAALAALLFAAALPVAVAQAASPEGGEASEDLRKGALRALSEQGLYVAEITPIDTPVDTPIPMNQVHEWRVHLESADGVAVTGATIAVSGGMPMHNHGLPTAPRVTEDLGGGDYRLEGMKFQMPGHWVVTLGIDASAGADSVTFELML